MSKRSVIQLLTCALVALVTFLWLRPGPPASRPRAQPNHSPRMAAAEDSRLEQADSPSTHEREPAAIAAPTLATSTFTTEKIDRLFGQPGLVLNAVLVVQVLAEDTLRPLAGVRVRTVQKEPQGSSMSMGVASQTGSLNAAPITAAAGEVELRVPSGEDLRVTASGEEGDIGESTLDVPRLSKDERRVVTIRLHVGKDTAFFGRVISETSHERVAHARVVALSGGSEEYIVDPSPAADHQTLLGETTSDTDGRFELRLGSWKRPALRLDAAGFGLRLVIVTGEHSSRQTEFIVPLRRSASFGTHLVDSNGAPMAGLTVSASMDGIALQVGDDDAYSRDIVPNRVKWTATTDAGGDCMLRDLPSGVPFRVEVIRSYKPPQKEGELAALDPGEVRRVTLTLGGGCIVKGVLQNDSGSEVPNCDVWLLPAKNGRPRMLSAFEHEDVVAKARSDLKGQFVLRDVRPGFWLIGPSSGSFDFGDNPLLTTPATVVEIVAGCREQQVTITIPRGLLVHGTVVDTNGAQIPGLRYDLKLWMAT
jgi:hypothetical protein